VPFYLFFYLNQPRFLRKSQPSFVRRLKFGWSRFVEERSNGLDDVAILFQERLERAFPRSIHSVTEPLKLTFECRGQKGLVVPLLDGNLTMISAHEVCRKSELVQGRSAVQ
jgi:hypothetical protein